MDRGLLSGVAVARALSSEESWKILDLLMSKELDERGVSRALGAGTRSVRPQLERLVEAGLVSSREKHLRSGRPRRMYRLTGTAKSVVFPPRDYLRMSEALINSLRSSLGEDGARTLLHDMGVRIGEDAAHAFVSGTQLTKWDTGTFTEYFVKKFLTQMGLYPKIVTVGKNQVVYEERNCLFQDLAMKYPGLVCDVLDEGVHEGLHRKLGTRVVRLKCKGHGDPVCMYRAEWHRAEKSPQRRTLRSTRGT